MRDDGEPQAFDHAALTAAGRQAVAIDLIPRGLVPSAGMLRAGDWARTRSLRMLRGLVELDAKEGH
jgi:hypothetical protein